MKPRAPRLAAAAFAFVLSVLVVSILALGAPEPLPATAGADEFSADRAFVHVTEIAQRPHPPGDPDHDRVRDYLVARLEALGLEPAIQTGAREIRWLRRLDEEGPKVTLENVCARIPGSAGQGSVLVMAHYDSVARGPGAGDNAVGVAAVLEALRAFDVARDFENDLIVLFDDGEEMGLLGARLFAEEHPWADDVRLVLNFDARGNGGPSIMYETGPDNARLVAELAKHAPQPTAASFASAVYERMPNDSSFSPFRERAVPGLNFAFIGGASTYHSSFDTPANVSRASLQHHGETALALMRVAVDLDLGELGSGGDAVFFNLGRRLVHYPLGWTLPLSALALALLGALLLAAVRLGRMRARDLVLGAVFFPFFAAAVGLGTWLVWWLIDFAVHLASGLIESVPRGNLLSATLASIGLIGIACAIALVLLGRLHRASADGDARLVSLACGGTIWWGIGLLSLALALPAGAYLALWPLLAATLALALLVSSNERGEASPIAAAVRLAVFVPIAAILMPPYYLFFLTGAIRMSGGVTIGAITLALGSGVLMPQLCLMLGTRRWTEPAISAVLGVAALFAASLAAVAGL